MPCAIITLSYHGYYHYHSEFRVHDVCPHGIFSSLHQKRALMFNIMLKDQDTPYLWSDPNIFTIGKSLHKSCVAPFKSFIEVKLNSDEALLASIWSDVSSIKVRSKVFSGSILQEPQSFIEANNFKLGSPITWNVISDSLPDHVGLLHTVQDALFLTSGALSWRPPPTLIRAGS